MTIFNSKQKVFALNGATHVDRQTHKTGFTLAEVLITLSIIGVVAAMTIPTLVNNSQKTQAVTGYKKTYSVISQTIGLSEAANGTSDSWAWSSTLNLSSTQAFADNYFYPYIKTLKKCENTDASCWKAPVSLDGTGGYLVPSTVASSSALSAILVDGSSILFWAGINPPHVQIWVDIDGPNRGQGKLGRDVFNIIIIIDNSIFNKGVYSSFPSFLSLDTAKNDATYGCNKSVSGQYAGRFCGALIQLDGWQIKDDYPW